MKDPRLKTGYISMPVINADKIIPSRKHAYIILTPLNPTFI